MAYCEHCGFRIERGAETCRQCGHLDFSYVSDDAKSIDPNDVDNVLEHEPDRENPAGFLGIVQLFRRRKK